MFSKHLKMNQMFVRKGSAKLYKKCNIVYLNRGIYSMAKCHGCTLVINQSYWFEILQTVIKSFEGWGQVIIFLLLDLTLLVFSVSIISVYKSL